MSTADVSIVVPIRNAGHRADVVGACLRSLIMQSLSSSVDVIVIDDASTDETPQVVAEALGRASNVHWVRNETRLGACCSRNLGAELARSEWVFIADDDVVAEEYMISDLLSTADAFECDFIYQPYDVVDWPSGAVKSSVPLAAWDPAQLLVDLVSGVPANRYSGCALFRRRTFVGFDPRVPRFQDFEMWGRMALLGLLGAPVIQRRRHHERGFVSIDHPDRISNTISAEEGVRAIQEIWARGDLFWGRSDL